MKAETTPCAGSRRKSRRTFNKFMKVTRRIHMYLGLLLVPWVILFGMSGFLFNHGSTFWGGSVEELMNHTPSQANEEALFSPIDPEEAADQILSQINASLSTDASYARSGSASIYSELRLSGQGEEGSINFYLDLENGNVRATTTRPPQPKQVNPEFHNHKASLAGFDFDAVLKHIGTLAARSGLELQDELASSGRGSNAQLRFDLRDADGKHWHTVYDFVRGTVTSRSGNSDTGLNFHSAVTKLHKTHHYPHKISAKWIWIVLGDFTAISMVVWGVTGLVMWWQIQPTRAVGTIAIFMAAIASFFIFSGNLKEMTYAPVSSQQSSR